jgi:serine/threonine protein kinase
VDAISIKRGGGQREFLPRRGELVVTARAAVGDAGVVETGSQLAGYRIERVLATGGTCVVYLVHDPVLPRLDALKVLNADLAADAGLREQFIRESDIGARLHHPNIVSIYSRGEAEDGRLWIAMQYVAGTDAEAALASGSMNPPRALRIVSEVAKALDYAHRLELVHADVKPSNFLLSPDADSGDEHVLLSDFGISRTIGEHRPSSGDAALTLSLAYAAPEVLAGGDVAGDADTYSLGCTLFRLLTGKHVFSQAEGTAGLVEAHLRQPPPRISDFMSGSSPQLDSVIAKALAKDPAQRFSSAREFAAAATEALNRTTRAASAIEFAAPRASTPPDPAAVVNRWRPGEHWAPAPDAPPPPPMRWAGPERPRDWRPSVWRRAMRMELSRKTVLAGAAALTAIGVLVGVVVATEHPSPTPPPAERPPAGPTAPASSPPDPRAQERLAGLIPGGYPPGSCNPGGVTSAAEAAELCGPNVDPGGPTSATYTLSRSLASLRAAMNDVFHTAAPVICPPNILSPGPWHRTENPTAAVGIVFCGIRSGRPLVAWTNEPELLLCTTLSDTSGPPIDQLFTWWTSHS